MAAALSDEAWADIRAAGGLMPDVEARPALAALLFAEYPAFAYRRAEVEADLRRSKRMLKHLDAFEKDYRARFTADDVRTEADLWCIKVLQRRPLAVWQRACAIRRANKGKMSVQHEWLYHRLCGIWLDHFHAPGLSVTRGGPLSRFILAAMREIMPPEELPKPDTVHDGIKRERDERARCAQLSFEFRAAVKKRGVD